MTANLGNPSMSIKKRLLITAVAALGGSAVGWGITFLTILWCVDRYTLPIADAIGIASVTSILTGGLPVLIIWMPVAIRASQESEQHDREEWIEIFTAAGFTREQALLLRQLHPTVRPPRLPRRTPDQTANSTADSAG